ncbi:MAG: MerR family transcriptional regulator [Robiginitomaculum sp.]|nr:MerR family transcriptional regulator [Robiginitomaculum sp.]MDQ7079011.1 MerR family transcriptional regulator [Robiginitomaculum sp.]
MSEAAQEVGVPAHVLRFWESRFSQISPMKKGGGRRYYRPEDIALLSGIRALLYDDGLSIKQVQAELKVQGVPAIAARGRKENMSRATPEVVGANDVQTRPSLESSSEDQDLVHQRVDEDESRAETAKERENHDETQERLSDALQKLLNARERLNETLQKH